MFLLLLMSCSSVFLSGEYSVIEIWLEPVGDGMLTKALQENYGDMCFNFRENGELHTRSTKMKVQNEGEYCIDEDLVLIFDQAQAAIVDGDSGTYDMRIQWGLLEEDIVLQFCESFEFSLEINSGHSLKEMEEKFAC